MKGFFLLLTILSFFIDEIIFSQSNKFNSLENIRKFADYLYCDNDYIRAILEYERYLNIKSIENSNKIEDDTVMYKISLSQIKLNKYNDASTNLKLLFNSELKDESILQYYKINFMNNNFTQLSNDYYYRNIYSEKYSGQLSIYFILSNLMNKKLYTTDDEEKLLKELNNISIYDKNKIISFISYRRNQQYKNSLKASVLSTIIPGSGKIYTKNYGGGITSFILTSLFTFLSIDNFNSNHNFRGFLFGGISLFFYSGNIYGSVASANIYNAKKVYEFNHQIDNYLEKNNYLIPYKIEFQCEE